MSDSLTVYAPERDDVLFAARMTNIQFSALAKRLDRSVVVSDLEALVSRRRAEKGKLCHEAEVRKWLLNGWNTELLLRSNRALLNGDALRHSLHWAFPQAYYAVYAVTLAYFKAVGFSEESHASVIRKFGSEADTQHYPAAMCALARGYPPEPHGVTAYKLPHSTYYDAGAAETVEAQLAQFLCATRKMDLAAKKGDIKLQTKSGQRRKAFRLEDWAKVSAALGHTSLLSLLYRKRIKANYRDIDTFLHEELNAQDLSLHIINVVSTMNLVHEVLIAQALGSSVLKASLVALPGNQRKGPHVRLALVERLTA